MAKKQGTNDSQSLTGNKTSNLVTLTLPVVNTTGHTQSRSLWSLITEDSVLEGLGLLAVQRLWMKLF